jgi:hypothetical protein
MTSREDAEQVAGELAVRTAEQEAALHERPEVRERSWHERHRMALVAGGIASGAIALGLLSDRRQRGRLLGMARNPEATLPLSYPIRCGGEQHTITFMPDGSLRLEDHNFEMLAAFTAFGAKAPRCFQLYEEWRGNAPWKVTQTVFDESVITGPEVIAIAQAGPKELRGHIAMTWKGIPADVRYDLAMASTRKWRGIVAKNVTDLTPAQRMKLAHKTTPKMRSEIVFNAPGLTAQQRYELAQKIPFDDMGRLAAMPHLGLTPDQHVELAKKSSVPYYIGKVAEHIEGLTLDQRFELTLMAEPDTKVRLLDKFPFTPDQVFAILGSPIDEKDRADAIMNRPGLTPKQRYKLALMLYDPVRTGEVAIRTRDLDPNDRFYLVTTSTPDKRWEAATTPAVQTGFNMPQRVRLLRDAPLGTRVAFVDKHEGSLTQRQIQLLEEEPETTGGRLVMGKP